MASDAAEHLRTVEQDQRARSLKYLREFRDLQGNETQVLTDKFHFKQVLQGFDFFRELEEATQLKLPQIMNFKSYSAGSVLVRQGDAPDGDSCCYILLSGECSVWLLCDDDAPDSSEADGPQLGNSRSDAEEDTGTPERAGGFGKRVATLTEGRLFGELALMHDQPRMATVTCEGDCDFLVIQRTDFDRVLKQEMTQLKGDKIEFLRKHVPGVRRLPEKRVQQILYAFKKFVFPRGHTFFTQGEVTKAGLYVIVDGSVELSRQDSSEVCRTGALMSGSIFGSLDPQRTQRFTVKSLNSRCEILQLATEKDLRRLPCCVKVDLQEHLAATEARHSLRCGGGAKSGSGFCRPVTAPGPPDRVSTTLGRGAATSRAPPTPCRALVASSLSSTQRAATPPNSLASWRLLEPNGSKRSQIDSVFGERSRDSLDCPQRAVTPPGVTPPSSIRRRRTLRDGSCYESSIGRLQRRHSLPSLTEAVLVTDVSEKSLATRQADFLAGHDPLVSRRGRMQDRDSRRNQMPNRDGQSASPPSLSPSPSLGGEEAVVARAGATRRVRFDALLGRLRSA